MDQLIKKYNDGERNFDNYYIIDKEVNNINFNSFELKNTHIYYSTFNNCEFNSSYLINTCLTHSCFINVKFQNVNFENVTLLYSKFINSNLNNSSFKDSNLSGTNFVNTDLSNVKLENINLDNTRFNNSVLSNTILDPNNQFTPPTDKELLDNGFEVDGDFVYGFRTKQGQHYNFTIYEPGAVYTAPVFSTDMNSSCHPGIYIASKKWLEKYYSYTKLVKVCCRREDLLNVGNKFRAKKIMVLKDID